MPKEKKSNNVIKIILIFAAVFILIPTMVFTLIYFTNNNFRKSANEFLRGTPGVVGEYFSKYPTESEKADKELFLANYYLSISKESAADKLYIIKKSEEELYDKVIKKMNQTSSSKTNEVIKLVRSIELRKDLLFTLYEEIKEEQEKALSEEIKKLENLGLNLAIKETELLVDRSISGEELGKIFYSMKVNRAVEILYYVRPDVKDRIISNIETKKRKELDTLLLQKQNKDDELRRNSLVYEVMDIEKAFTEIGDSKKYKVDELSKIYMGLSIQKASEILINSEEEFINSLISKIEELEELTGEEESRAVKIMETMNFHKQYSNKISELVALYEKMDAEDIVKIVEEMMKNNNSVTVFEIDENPIYDISDSSIILDVMKKMKKQKMSQILSIMDSKKAAEITRRLAVY